eukprot:gene10845-3465_t
MNKTSRQLLNSSNSFFITENFNNYIDQSLDFTFKLPKEELKNQSHIHLIKYPGKIPDNFDEIVSKNYLINRLKFRVLNDDGFPCFGRVLGNGRLDTQNWISLTITQIFYIILLFLSFYYRNDYPMNTRSIAPFVVLIFQLCNNFLYHSMTYLDYEQRNYNLCFFEVFGIYPLEEVTFFLPPILLFRYFLITKAKYQKVIQYQMDKRGEVKVSLPIRFKLLKILGDTKTLIVFLIFMSITYQIIYFVTLAGFQFKCSNLQDTTIIAIHFSIITISISFYILYSIIDAVVHINLLFKCQILKFIQTDRFFSRIELLFAFPAYIVFLIFNFVPHSDIIHFILSSLLRYILVFLVVILSLTITIILSFKKIFLKKEMEYHQLDAIFENDEYKESFEKFCVEEYSIENFSFRVDVMKYKKINQKSKREMAIEIIEKYLTSESLLELNTSTIKIDRIKNIIDSGTLLKDDLFDSVLNDANINLFDTYSRWISTKEFQLIKQKGIIIGSVLTELPKRQKTILVQSQTDMTGNINANV